MNGHHGPRIRRAAITLLALGIVAADAGAQIRGRRPTDLPQRSSTRGWWFSGGAAGLVINDINDGASQKRWRFGGDPLWQVRGTLERELDDATTLGVSAGYGVVDVALERLPGLPLVDPLPSTVCPGACAADVQTWQLMGQFRSGSGRPGFHTFFEAQGGVIGFRNLRTKDTREAIGTKSQQFDLAGTLGFGFGYTLSPGLVFGLVQDFGIGFHAKTDIPEANGRTYRLRTTRASLRFRL